MTQQSCTQIRVISGQISTALQFFLLMVCIETLGKLRFSERFAKRQQPFSRLNFGICEASKVCINYCFGGGFNNNPPHFNILLCVKIWKNYFYEHFYPGFNRTSNVLFMLHFWAIYCTFFEQFCQTSVQHVKFLFMLCTKISGKIKINSLLNSMHTTSIFFNDTDQNFGQSSFLAILLDEHQFNVLV